MNVRLRSGVIGVLMSFGALWCASASAASDSWVYTDSVLGLIDAGFTFPGTANVRLVDVETGSIEMTAVNGDIFRVAGEVTGTGFVQNRAYIVVNTPTPSTVFQLANGFTGLPVVNSPGGAPTGRRFHHWDDPANWMAGGVPNGVSEVATFGNITETGDSTRISLDTDITLGKIEWTGGGVFNRDLELFGGVVIAKKTLTFATSDSSTPSIIIGGTRPFSLVGTNTPDSGLNIAGSQGLYMEVTPAIRVPDAARAPGSAIRLNPGLSWNGFSGTLTMGQGNLDPVAGGLLPPVRFVLGTGLDESMNPRWARLGMFSGRNQTIGGFDGNSNSWVGNNGTGFSTLTVGSNHENGDFAGIFGRNDATDAGLDTAGPRYRSNINITKIGTGVQKFSGTSFGAGTTTINGGTFLMNGTHIATGTATGEGDETSPNAPATTGTFGQYVVNNGGILGGVGSITPFDTEAAGDPMISISDGAVLSPGDGGTGTLTINGASSVNPLVEFVAAAGNGGGKGLFDLGPFGASDILALSGGDLNDIIFINTTLNFNVLPGATSGDYTLFTSDVAGAFSGLMVGGGGLITDGLSIGSGLEPGSSLKLVGNNIVVSAIVGSVGTPGDFDDDGDVDGRDFLIWQRGGSPNPLSAGDLSAWQSNYGTGGLASVVAASVPEPSSTMLAAMAVLALSVVGRCQSRRDGSLNEQR